MSTTPPNNPGGTPPPYPPYDAKAQYRAYREQQKAAWRAQRDAWKAQSHAWKASYIGAYGPRVPSVVGPIVLIGIGVVALLVMTGHLAANGLASWYGHWWPLLLIAAGLALLAEWALDLRREVPVRRSGGFVGILILLAILGVCASGWNHMGQWHGPWGDHGDDFFNTFGLPEHDMDQQVLHQQIPANAVIEIENPRGEVSITAVDGSTIEVQAHAVAYASSDIEAAKIFGAEAAHLTVNGSAVMVKSESNSNGRLNLTISVPKTARVTVNAGKGDVTASGLGSGVNVMAHGDVHLSAIAGPVETHFSNGKHDFSAHDVQGDLSVNGDVNDLTFSEIKGRVTQSGEILGDVHMENVSGAIHLHTSVTDLQVANLPGDLTLNSDDLRVNQAKGDVRVTTHSKDIDLSQISGDSFVETRNGRISVEPAGNYAVDAKNSKGDVEVTLPPSTSATVNAHSRNGDIISDFAMPSSGEGENKLATFTIGSGKQKIVLSAENGDVRIKKGSNMAMAPVVPVPPVPPNPNAPHLKAPKVPPAKPVAQ